PLVSLSCPRCRATPTSPCFPYTAPFRSRLQRGGSRTHRPPGVRNRPEAAPEAGVGGQGQRARNEPPLAGGCQPGGQLPAPLPGEDRKSTRLNSSHAKISYADFCLKKNKN